MRATTSRRRQARPSVDELFARIRAGAPDEVAEAGAGGGRHPEPATEAVPEAATQAMAVVVVEEQVEAADAAPGARTTR